jgi:uncharacterized protein (DUF433 family)
LALLEMLQHNILMERPSSLEQAMKQLTRITSGRAASSGKPCVRGLPITVGTLLSLLASGRSRSDILALYPELESEDLDEALAYAARQLDGEGQTAGADSTVRMPGLHMDALRAADDFDAPLSDDFWVRA